METNTGDFLGDKLDQKHCETLEEILRRVQFRTLDLEATHLEEEVGLYSNAILKQNILKSMWPLMKLGHAYELLNFMYRNCVFALKMSKTVQV